MGKLIKNPIVYSFVIIGAILLLLSIFIGVHISQALQLIFFPYTYDIAHGIGATGSIIYSVVLSAIQVGLIMLITIGIKLEGTFTRRIVWGAGVVLVTVYFVFMGLGYLINNFH